MPLLRRIPKRGFNSRFKNAYQVVNVESLNRFEVNSIVGPDELKKAGLVGSTKEPIKILGDGKITKVITIKAHKFSESAKKLLEGAGCQLVIASPEGAKQSLRLRAERSNLNKIASSANNKTTTSSQ